MVGRGGEEVGSVEEGMGRQDDPKRWGVVPSGEWEEGKSRRRDETRQFRTQSRVEAGSKPQPRISTPVQVRVQQPLYEQYWYIGLPSTRLTQAPQSHQLSPSPSSSSWSHSDSLANVTHVKLLLLDA